MLEIAIEGERQVLTASGGWSKQDNVRRADDDMHMQVYCEMLGVIRGVESFLPYLRGKAVLHLTDCAPVCAVAEAGSGPSEFLQQHALQLWRLTTQWGIHMVTGWVPGDDMVSSGVDYWSREGAIDTHNEACTDEAWQLAATLAKLHGVNLGVDWFAMPGNARCERFWSRHHSLGCEGVDAMKAPSWAEFPCDGCGCPHDQGAFLFPPLPMAAAVVDKAKRDGAKGVAILPYCPNSKWWPVLAEACVEIIELPQAPIMHLPNADASYARMNWKMCCFDFRPDKVFVHSQCKPARRWQRGTPSPEELHHKRHLLTLLAAVDQGSTQHA